MATLLALVACQDAHRIEVLHDPVPAAPRVFTWQLVHETAEMSDGVFVTDREGWVVGPYGTILHTTNGGAAQADWQAVDTGTTNPLSTIAAVPTPAGAFALVTGKNVALRYSTEHPSWEPVPVNPADKTRPSLHVTADGRVEAWLATTEGFVHTADARTGGFTKATLPASATEVVFADDGDSWTIAPVGTECVPYRKPHDEVDWQPVPVPLRAPTLSALGLWNPGLPTRSPVARGGASFTRAQVCADARLLVTLERKKLWFVLGDAVSEWDGQEWINYDHPADGAPAPPATPTPDSVSDRSEGGVPLVLLPRRSPPTLYLARPSSVAAPREAPHERAPAAWAKARATKFSVADLWMRGDDLWAAGRDGFAHSTDGGQTWTVQQVDQASSSPAAPGARPAHRPAQPGGVTRPPVGTALRKLALNQGGTQGWAVADDGEVYHYDGAWAPQFKLDAMDPVRALSLTSDGDVAWLLTRDALYRMTTLGSTVVLTDAQNAMEMLLVCPDGRSGWVRYGGYHWYAYDGAAWTKASARPSLACLSPRCAQALAQVDPDSVVCAAGDQIWSLSQGQTADGASWTYPIPGLEPVQSLVAQLRADSPAAPARMFATAQDGMLLRTDAHTDQPSIVEPGAILDGTRVVLSWALSGTSPAPPTWSVEYCVVYGADVCTRDSAAWVVDTGVRQAVEGGRYLATVDPGKLSLKPDTKVQYRIRVTLADLRRAPLRVAEVTLGESLGTTVWGVARPYVVSVALWFLGLLALWGIAPRVLLHINAAVQQWVSRLPLFGNLIGSLVGVVLARTLVRTPRVVTSWIQRELRAPAPVADPAAGAVRAPAGFARIADPELRAAFQAMTACQRAWIALHGERAARAFEGSKFATERAAYGEVRVTVRTASGTRELSRGVGLEDLRELVAPVSADPKLVLWISGKGGVGKSHLACRASRWLAKQALLPHPAIVVVIDGNAETRDALDALIRARLEALTQATDIDANLVAELLASASVVLLFDGLTERSPRTIQTVQAYLESLQAPALTLCTARSPHDLTARRCITLEPMPLDAGELLPFLSSYRLSLPADLRRSEELLEPVRKAAKGIADGERRTLLTPLLVTLLWDEAVASAASSRIAVEVFRGYVARALVPTGNAADLAEQRRLALVRARVLGRLALGKNYRPGRWFTRDAAANSLRTAGVASTERDVLHDFIAAGLLEEDAPGGGQLRFLLDPLSEYLCALSILYAHDGNEPEWAAFLQTLDALSPEDRVAADGFLVALADCSAAYGATLQLTSVPQVNDVRPAPA